jgi:hypothetical protein
VIKMLNQDISGQDRNVERLRPVMRMNHHVRSHNLRIDEEVEAASADVALGVVGALLRRTSGSSHGRRALRASAPAPGRVVR